MSTRGKYSYTEFYLMIPGENRPKFQYGLRKIVARYNKDWIYIIAIYIWYQKKPYDFNLNAKL